MELYLYPNSFSHPDLNLNKFPSAFIISLNSTQFELQDCNSKLSSCRCSYTDVHKHDRVIILLQVFIKLST